MQNAIRMRDYQSIDDLVDLRRDLADLARSGASNQTRNASLLCELHSVPGEIAARIPIINRNDRRVRQLRSEPGLSRECTHSLVVASNRWMQGLERHLTLER